MGMFDELQCHYPLPVEGAKGLTFQTKDTPAQFIEKYEIREDGTLWHQIYDIEDRSDPNAEGLLRMAGCLSRGNSRWEREYLSGAMRFYTSKGDEWLEFIALFLEGVLREVRRVEEEQPPGPDHLGLHLMPINNLVSSARLQEREACAQIALNMAANLEHKSCAPGAKAAREIAEQILGSGPTHERDPE